MKVKDRIVYAVKALTGNLKIQRVHLKGRVIYSHQHTPDGGGTVEILGAFSQRGLGALNAGDIVNISFTAIQEDSPMRWTMETRDK